MIPQAETVTSNPVYRQASFWIAVIAVIGTLGNGYMMFQSSNTSIELERMRTILEYQGNEIEKARARDAKNVKIILEQGMQIMRLTGQLQDKISEVDLLNGFMESLPFPAWIKERGDDGIFRIVTINEQLTVEYGFTKREMIGNSDYELYPLDLAEEYQRGDREVYDSGSAFRSKTEIISRGERVPIEYIKFQMELPSGFQGIGGVVID